MMHHNCLVRMQQQLTLALYPPIVTVDYLSVVSIDPAEWVANILKTFNEDTCRRVPKLAYRPRADSLVSNNRTNDESDDPHPLFNMYTFRHVSIAREADVNLRWHYMLINRSYVLQREVRGERRYCACRYCLPRWSSAPACLEPI